jgi:CRISPR-associated protein (TIGR02584 family)
MKKILALVSGMSPAIITETIYALAIDEDPWIPDEIYIFTTAEGKRKIISDLLDKNIYKQMCSELNITEVMSAKSIITVQHKGVDLEDIRTSSENDIFANFLVDGIHDLCENSSSELYVSLAGGRKTMSYYMGYALSLFGRPQDKLFHVLVSSPFDGGVTPVFYYPNTNIDYVDRNGNLLNGSTAELELAEIPYVSIRNSYPKDLVKKGRFSESLRKIQNEIDPNTATLKLVDASFTIICNDIAVKLTTLEYAIYYFFAASKFEEDERDRIYRIEDIDPKDIFAILENLVKLDWRTTENTFNKFKDSYIKTTKDNEQRLKDFNSALRKHIHKINTKIVEQLTGVYSHFKIDCVTKEKDEMVNKVYKLYSINVLSDNIEISLANR